MSHDSIEVVMKRWRENRDAEWSEAMEADALRIADHACEVMPKLVEALETVVGDLHFATTVDVIKARQTVRNCIAIAKGKP